MAKMTRSEVQHRLEELLGSDLVYFQPPESMKMRYPCLVYTIQSVDVTYADDSPWIIRDEYLVSSITREPDDPMVPKLIESKGFSFDRHYVADNLHHNVFRYTVY